jgi:hypothetical protein
MSDAGPPRPGRGRRSLGGALAGMAVELVYVAVLAGIGLMVAMAASLLR